VNITFRHDGWRAQIAGGFDNESVVAVTRAFGLALRNLHRGERQRVVVGFDRRFLSSHFARLTADTLASHGLDVWLCRRPLPTPALSLAVKESGSTGGLMISASGSPAEMNGLIFRGGDGGAITASLWNEIDQCFRDAATPGVTARGTISEIDPLDDYLAYVGRLAGIDRIRSAGLSIAVDPMFGVAAGLYSTLLAGDDTKCVEINNQVNPLFPGLSRPSPVDENLARLRQVVVSGAADVGFAFDGDGDRLGLIDERGAHVDGDTLFALLTRYELDIERNSGMVLKSSNSTRMVSRLAEAAGCQSRETASTFSDLSREMTERNAIFAGDGCGGFAVRRHLTERDGLLSSLLVCNFLIKTGQPVSMLVEALQEEHGPSFVRRRVVLVPSEVLDRLETPIDEGEWSAVIAERDVVAIAPIDGVKVYFSEGDWLQVSSLNGQAAVRLSAEASSAEKADEILNAAHAWLAG
jgi:phosphomannomutase